MTASALAGVRVLDLSRLLPGGFCSLLLADHGADVLKVEDTGAGDYIRWASPRVEGAAEKRGLRAVPRPESQQALDPHRSQARHWPRRAACARARPRLWPGGPLRDRPGHELNYLGLTGVLSLSGEPDGPPVQAAGQIADLGGGALMAAFAILAALRERDRSGEGQHIDVAMADGALSWLALVAARRLAGATVPARPGRPRGRGRLLPPVWMQ